MPKINTQEEVSLNIPEEQLKLACLSLQNSLPEMTPNLLKRILMENYSSTKDRIELISVKEAARYLGVCEMTIYRMVQAGKVKKYPVGNGRIFRLNKFELI